MTPYDYETGVGELVSPDYYTQSAHAEQMPEMIERVAQQNVRYLVFEGGGGKGAMFLGAVQALHERGILRYANNKLVRGQQIEGIAGSSAGALTAVMLSIGYTPQMLDRFLLGSYNFNRFMDLPSNPPKIPSPIGCVSTGHRRSLQRIFDVLTGPVVSRLINFAAGTVPADADLMGKLMSRHFFSYLSNLLGHYGIFSGCEAHELFNQKIAERAALVTGQRDPRRFRNLNFQQHKQIFGIDLVLTGSNFSTGKTQFFSANTTPLFPVAAAARISMSLPLVFKPMVIPGSMARQLAARSSARNPQNLSASALTGVWVDGGYFNNLPQMAFVGRPGAFQRTLGFSLSDYNNRPNSIRHFGDFLAAYAEFGMFGGGESQNSATTGVRDNTVDLVAGDSQFEVSTIKFGFTRDEIRHVRRLIAAAKQTTLNYF